MTIKTRNRLTLGFLIFAVLIFVAEFSLLAVQLFRGNFQFPKVVITTELSRPLIFRYSPVFVIIGIFLQNLYVCLATLFILRSFEKTQTTEIFFFAMFLLANIADSFRIFIPLFHISYTYSALVLVIGNITLFSRLMIPLSLMGTVILNDEDHRQNIERNSLLLIVVASFLASFIPLNTSVIKPNFLVSYAYTKTILVTTIAIHAANILFLFVTSLKQETKQYITIGYIILTLGSYFMFTSCSPFFIILGFLLLSSGTYLFMRSLHKYYLWND